MTADAPTPDDYLWVVHTFPSVKSSTAGREIHTFLDTIINKQP